MKYVIWTMIAAFFSLMIFTQVLRYKTLQAQKSHYAVMEKLEAEYNAESIRISEEFNDIMRAK